MARFPSGRLDRFHLLILDDLAYVTKDQAETSVLFELIAIVRSASHWRTSK
jgi:DNA replication protein DnaC